MIRTFVDSIIRAGLKRLTSNLPCETIYGVAGPYLTRWTLHDRGADSWRVRLHLFHRSDEDRELHTHPLAWAVALLLAGGYTEVRLDGGEVVHRDLKPGNVNFISATTSHLVDLLDETRGSWSLIITGPIVASWGFVDRDTTHVHSVEGFRASEGSRPHGERSVVVMALALPDDDGLVAEVAHGLGADRLAALQAHAAAIVAAEEQDAREAHAGEALLDRLEEAFALHLIVGGLGLRRVAELEASAPLELDRSSGAVRYVAPLRRRYTRLRVLWRAGRDRFGRALYRVQCLCGSPPFATLGVSLRRRKTRSCGCLRNERVSAAAKSRHALARTAAGRRAA